jgi:hypothetical protein
MISGTPLEIARYLANKAETGSRTTYEQVAAEIDWGHPTGRGLAIAAFRSTSIDNLAGGLCQPR